MVSRCIAHYLITKSHSKYLIGSKRLRKRNKTELRIECIFGRGEFTGAFHLFIILSRHKTQALQIRTYGIYASYRINVHNVQQSVGKILIRQCSCPGNCNGRILPIRFGLTQIRKSHKVSVIGYSCSYIRSPYFNLGNYDIRVYYGQSTHCLVVVVIEILGKKKVSVVIVIVCLEIKFLHLSSALHCNSVRLGLLLRENSVQRKIAEFQFRLDTEQGLTALNKTQRQRKTYVAGFYQLNNIIFLSFVFQLQFVLEIERSFGVVIEIKVDCRSYLSQHIQLKVHIEIQRSRTPLAFAQSKIFVAVVNHSELYLGTSARTYIYVLSSENGFKQFAVHFKLRDKISKHPIIGRTYHFGSLRTAFPIIVYHLIHIVVLIFRKGQHFPFYNNIAYFLQKHVFITAFVILDGCLYVLRVVKIQRTADGIVYGISKAVALSMQSARNRKNDHGKKHKPQTQKHVSQKLHRYLHQLIRFSTPSVSIPRHRNPIFLSEFCPKPFRLELC